MSLRESLDEPVSRYMATSFAEVSKDDTVSAAAKAMMKAGGTEAVVDGGTSTPGILTERDIVYKVVASGRDPSRVRVREVMTSPMATVESESKVQDAIAKMSKLGVRRLGVTKGGKLVGIVTQKAVVSGQTGQSVALPELSSPKGFRCPYCDAMLKDRNELSKHIDQVHLGLGLLEGDTSKW